MARIPLTIDPSYCSSWSFWEGVREITQNAKDADEFDGFKMDISHFPRTNKLVISNEGTTVDASSLLLLGKSAKGDGEQRGRFGEGFVLGCLALVRAGHPVTIYNGEEVWRPAIETPDEGHIFEGSKLLVFNTRKLQSMRTAFTVEIENVSKDVWEVARKRFLFVQPTKAAETVQVNEGTVLLGDDYKGLIFARGIYVTTVEDLECGYDLRHVKLDRDRRMVDEWDLKWKLGQVWSEAHRFAPEKFSPRVYRMAKEGKAEVKNLQYHADRKLLDALRSEFEKEHGEGAVPVGNMQESRELEKLGAKTVVVDKTLQELLEKGGSPLSEVKKKLEGTIKTRFAWGDLTEDEKTTGMAWIETVTKDYIIVEFNDDAATCKNLPEENVLAVARKLLGTPRELLRAVVEKEAQRKGTDAVSTLLDVIFRKV